MLSTFLTSAGLVAVAEIGDKTQLLSMVLSAQFRRPLPIVAGTMSPAIEPRQRRRAG